MYAASREALSATLAELESAINNAGSSEDAVAAQIGTQIFAVVDLLDEQRSARMALADASAPAQSRTDLAERLLANNVSTETLSTVKAAVSEDWAKPSDLVNSLVTVGRIALMRSAAAQNQLETVEDELFRLSRITVANAELEQALSDRTKSASGTKTLLSRLLYGKVTAITEALAIQAVSRSNKAPADEFAELAALAAEQRERTVAHVRSATALSEEQEARLKAALSAIYGKEIAVHVEVDPELLSGLVVRVGDEVIDGSAAGRLAALRKALK
ncbi:F0F1 ATP synthase subunit delta [Hoyosella rhizosphaerae]|uniref:ATP synthase subunit delta n=1 Tax=Hoyosella rhizosphaerae TaxID=1755582 RepID=A0A916UES3_9ACTN|nr:F0F1 ATP synthase subunit delta [Hoyosella rhizosphaerae]MBN4927834.1 F0F1 ATP synthase subunit delta [Hoyosella rhizosphaerae]GGC70340.1 ATP synthase subunit delta [Hoyosella rhizosphaerae]